MRSFYDESLFSPAVALGYTFSNDNNGPSFGPAQLRDKTEDGNSQRFASPYSSDGERSSTGRAIECNDIANRSGQFKDTATEGQYLDVECPGIDQVGGFTITSPPSTAAPTSDSEPYVELAIQRSPNNPPAAYLWRPVSELLRSHLQIRVGGAFFYPPASFSLEETSKIDRVVLIAGGVGINPIMSILSAMHGRAAGWVGAMPRNVRVLYTTRRTMDDDGGPQEILFEGRLKGIANTYKSGHAGDKLTEVSFKFTLFETGRESVSEKPREEQNGTVRYEHRRITHADLNEALGPEASRENTVAYVCGPPPMTDDFVDFLQRSPGMQQKRVLCEKWW